MKKDREQRFNFPRNKNPENEGKEGSDEVANSSLSVHPFSDFHNHFGNQTLNPTVHGAPLDLCAESFLGEALLELGGFQIESGNAEAMEGLARKTSNRKGNVEDARTSLGALMKQSGRPLPFAIKSSLERSFGTSLDHVRIHTNAKAEEATRAVQAKAFATGRDIAFSSGSFDSSTQSGQELIAHEVAHVVQFGQGRMGTPSKEINGVGVSTSTDAIEVEADTMASHFVDNMDESYGGDSSFAETSTGSNDLIMRTSLSDNDMDEDEPTEDETEQAQEEKTVKITESDENENNEEKPSEVVESNGLGEESKEESKEEKEGDEKKGGEAENKGQPSEVSKEVDSVVAGGEEQVGEEEVSSNLVSVTEIVSPVSYSSTPTLRYKAPKMTKKQAEKIKKKKGTHPIEAFNKVTKKAEEVVSLASSIKANLADQVASTESKILGTVQTKVSAMQSTHASATQKVGGSFESAKEMLNTACVRASETSKISISEQQNVLEGLGTTKQTELETTFSSINGQLETIQESAPSSLQSKIDGEGPKFDVAFQASLPKLKEHFSTAISDLPNGSEEEKLAKEFTVKELQKRQGSLGTEGAKQKDRYKTSVLEQYKNNAEAIVRSVVQPLRTEMDTQYAILQVQIDSKGVEAQTKLDSEKTSVAATMNGVKDTGVQSVEASKNSALSSIDGAKVRGESTLQNSGQELINNLRSSTQKFELVYNGQIEQLQPLMDQASKSPDVDSMMPQLLQTEESIKASAVTHGETIVHIQSSAETTLSNTATTYQTQLEEMSTNSSTKITDLSNQQKTSIDNKATAIVGKAKMLSTQISDQINGFAELMKTKATEAESKSVTALKASETKMLTDIAQAVSQQDSFLTNYAQTSVASSKHVAKAASQSKMAELRQKSTGLFNAMEGFGTKENVIFGLLRGLSSVQGSILRSIYVRQYGKSLSGHLKSELDDAMTSGDAGWRRARSALYGNAANAALLTLEQSLGTFNDDEATIKAELRSLSASELQKLHEMAKDNPEAQKIIDEVRNALGGEDLDIANTFLNADVDGSGNILTPDVEARNLQADAIEIYHAMDGWGTNEDAVYKGMEGKTEEQREALKTAYLDYAKNEYAKDANIDPSSVGNQQVMNLEDKIKDDFNYTGDGSNDHMFTVGKNYEGDIALGLLSGDDVAVKAARLEDASDGWFFGGGTDEKAILTQLKDTNLQEPASLGANPTPEQQAVYQQKKAAYDKAVGDRARLQTVYEERYGRSVEDMIGSEMGTDKDDYMGELARQTLQKGDGDRTLKLKAATDGVGTNEDLIKEALQTSSGAPLSKEELSTLQKKYKDEFGVDLIDDLSSDLSGKDQFDIDIIMMGNPTTPAEFRAIANKKHEYQRSGFSGAYMSMMGATGYYDSPEVFDRQKEDLDKKLDSWDSDIASSGTTQDPNAAPKIPKNINEAYGFFNDGFESYESAKMEVAEATGTAVAVIGAVVLTVATGGAASPALVAVLASTGMSATAATATAIAIGAMGTASLGVLSKAAIMGNSYGAENLAVDVANIALEGLTAGGGKYLSILAAQGQSVKYLQPLIDIYAKAGTLKGPGATLSQKVAGELLESMPETVIKQLFAATTSEANWDNDTVLQDFFMRMSVNAGGTALSTIFAAGGANIYDALDSKMAGGNPLSKAFKSEVFKDQFETAFKNMGNSLGAEGTQELLNFIADPNGYNKDFGELFTGMMNNAGIKVSKGVMNKAIDQFKSSYNKTMPVLEMILKGEQDSPKFKQLTEQLTPEQKSQVIGILLMSSINQGPVDSTTSDQPARVSSTKKPTQPESKTEIDSKNESKVLVPENATTFKEHLGEGHYDQTQKELDALAVKSPEAKNLLEKLTPAEAIALRMYTAENSVTSYNDQLYDKALYSNVNRSLYTGNEADIENFSSFIDMTKSGLSKLESYKGTVYRGASLPQAILDNYVANKGSVITEKGFLSTAYNPAPAEKFEKNAFYVIQSKNGKKIESLSHYQSPSENEVLFSAGTQFKVQDIGTNDKGSTVIYLEEV